MYDQNQIKLLYRQLKEQKIRPEEAAGKLRELQGQRTKAEDGAPEIYRYDESFLKDHTVNGEQVLIGMTHASLAMRTFFEWFPEQACVRLQRLNFVTPVAVERNGQVEVRIKPGVSEGKDTPLDFQAVYRENPSATWNLTATGKLQAAEFHHQRIDIQQVKSGLALFPDLTQLYADGTLIQFGESFKTVTQLHTGEDDVLARVALTRHAQEEPHSYEIHPLIAHSAFLAIVPILENAKGGGSFLPFGIKEFTYRKTDGLENCWIWAHLVNDAGEMILFDANVMTDDGTVVAHLAGCSLQRLRSDVQQPRTVVKPLAAQTPVSPQAALTDLAGSIQNYLVGKLVRLTGVDEGAYADTSTNLMELGLDSIQLVTLSDEIKQETDIDLDPTLFFEYPNLKELTRFFFEEHADAFRSMEGFHAAQSEPAEELAQAEAVGQPAIPHSEQPQQPQWQSSTIPHQTAILPENSGKETVRREDIAVIGMHGIFPDGADVDQFWRDIRDAKDLIREIPLDHWDVGPWYDENPEAKDRTYSKWGSFIADVGGFDPGFFSISPREAEWMDPQVRLTLQSIYATAEDAGVINRLRGSDTGVFIGICFNDYADKIADLRLPVDPYSGTGSSGIAANRASFIFDLTGPSLVINTACSSSLFALHAACHALRNGECGMAFVGGANLLLSSFHYRYFSAIKALSPTGRCHAFDAAADGYVPGEFVGSILLKPLSRAQADGDHIYAVVKGSAALHGGHSPSLTAPSVAGEENVIVKAWEDAGINPETISYIEAHGTGTKLGDPVELNSLQKAFRRYTQKEGFCAVGSVKANIGHTEGAAGMAGIMKVILQMQHREIPPLALFENLNPYIRLDQSALYINRESQAWDVSDAPRRAGINSFGFSGSYAHVVLEEYLPQRAHEAMPDTAPVIIALSARNKERLRGYAEKLLAFVQAPTAENINLQDLSYTLLVGREAMEERLGFIVGSMQELVHKLQQVVEGKPGGDFYQGNVKRAKPSDDDFSADEDMARTLELWLEKGKLAKLLNLWVMGLIGDWSGLFNTTYGAHDGAHPRPRRISLPTYAFAKERYWVPESALTSAPAVGHAAAKVIHPLLHENTSDLTQQCFTSRFTGQEFFLADHVVEGQKVLPGVAYLEMANIAVAKAAASLMDGPPEVHLKNLVWVRPIVVNDAQDVHIQLFQERNGEIAFHIYVPAEEALGQPLTCCQGTAIIKTSDHPAADHGMYLDLDALRQKINRNRILPQDCYQAFEAMGIEYGPGHRAIEAVHVGDQEVLAALKLPASVADTQGQFTLHPSLLDSALQASIGLSFGSAERDNRASLPFALDSLEIFRPCSESMWAWIRLCPSAKTAITKLDIDLCDGEGRICLKMSGYSARLLDKTQAEKSVLASSVAVAESGQEKPQTEPPRQIETEATGQFAPVKLEPEVFEKKAVAYFREQLANVLKLPADRVQPEEPLETYGIDSVLVMELTQELEKTFGSLSKTLFFEYQTIEEVSQYFVERHGDQLARLLQPEQMEQKPSPQETKAQPSTPETKTQTLPEQAMPRHGQSLTGLRQSRFSAVGQSPSTAQPSPASESGRRADAPLDIAIIGLSGKYPQSSDLDAYWRNLRDGRDCITEVPEDRWDWRHYYTEDRSLPGHHYSKWGGFIEDMDTFDPLFFQISPREAPYMDPQERLFLAYAWMALEDAGYQRSDFNRKDGVNQGDQVGVYAGVMYGHYQLYGAEETLRGNPIAVGGSYASIANRVSYILNLHGPSMTLDTMCSGSLTTLHLACQDLKHGHTDLAIAGGVNVTVHPNKYLMLSAGQFISSHGHCASFGEGGDGYVPSEGVGVAILKRLEDAERDGDHIYGVIKGSALNHGGKTNGYSVPNPNSQQAAIEKALKESGVDPRTISYIEAHGTGTKLGDPIEITGLSKAFGPNTEKQYCRIGSAKSNIGHCESAAGIAGVTKVLLQMKHGQIAPSLHSQVLNPNIDFSTTPFMVNKELRTWEQPVVDSVPYPRIAGVSSYGAGGSNAHMIIEEYQQAQKPVVDSSMPVVIPLSARNEERLKAYAERLLRFIREDTGSTARINLADLAYTLQVGREAMEERFACLVQSMPELEQRLRDFIAGHENEDLHLGNIHTHKDALAAFVSDEDLPTMIDLWISQGKMHRLADLWVKGLNVDWHKLYEGHDMQRISAPTYPFAQTRYWIKISGSQ
ncbi:MAG: hypothetical protein ETSY1_46105, partial (plasmid) [Candidatus Entotheonella factor]